MAVDQQIARAATPDNARRTIAMSYDAHRRDQRQRRTNPTTKMARLRRTELERLYGHRYGRTLPDDDSGRDDLALALHHVAGAAIDVDHRCRQWGKSWAPWMSANEITALIERVAANPIRYKAATLGRRLRCSVTVRAVLRTGREGPRVFRNGIHPEAARVEAQPVQDLVASGCSLGL